MRDVDWDGVWAAVGDSLRQYRTEGFHRLITEDVVRFTTVRALVAHGVPAADLRVEWAPPGLKGAHIDLALGEPPVAAVEFKYPREPVEKNAAWTQALGEVIKDFYRVAVLPAEVVTRMCALVSTARLRRYLGGAADRYGVDVLAGHVRLFPEQISTLPMTALGVVGTWASEVEVTAHAMSVVVVDDDLWLSPYRVEPAIRRGDAFLLEGGARVKMATPSPHDL